MTETEDVECGKPCPPDNPCDECADYWHRMTNEGLWNSVNHEWTNRGIREMCK